MSASSLSTHFLGSAAGGEPLRLGLLVDGPHIGRAAASIVRDLVAASFVRIELVLVDGGATDDGGSPFERLRAEGGFAYAAYATLDRRRAGRRDDPDRREDIGPLLAGLPTVTVDGAATERAELPDALVERARAASLDVVVHLGSRRLRGDILSAARHGAWALRPGDGMRWRGGPAGFWEVLDGSPVSSVVLTRLADGDADGATAGRPGLVLDRATVATDPTSLARTRRAALYGSTHLVVRNLRLLHERGWDWLLAHGPVQETGDPGSRPRDVAPSSRDVVRWFVPLALRRVVARVIRVVTRTNDVLHWRVAIRVGHASRLIDRADDLEGFRWLESQQGHYYADPFVVERDGRRWLFVEDFDYGRDAASIACAELGAAGEVGALREVLRADGHLSYPLVLDDGGDAWMVPESAAADVVRLYRATEFPDGWSPVADLLAETAVDTTIWRHDDRWWLTTTIAEPRGRAAMLMLYHAETLAGPWSSHPLNPISQDARSSRGGGNVFVDGGRLIRPSQDGSRGYGYALTFNEITILTPTDYAERPVATVTPGGVPGLLGLHTYNRLGDVEVIDGKVARPRSSVA